MAERDPRYVEAHKSASTVLDLGRLGPAMFLLYRRRRLFTAQHLVMTLHINSFGCLLGLMPLAVMSTSSGESIPVTLLFMAVYLGYIYLALRRVRGQGQGITAIRLFTLIVLNLVAAIVGTAGAMIDALFS